MISRVKKKDVSPGIKLRLFADSGGYCMNPDCNDYLYPIDRESSTHVAEVAHIWSTQPSGPRYDVGDKFTDNNDYDNLVLLCPTCHKVADKMEGLYTDDMLDSWKKSHKGKLESVFCEFTCTDRDNLCLKISPLLEENHIIHQELGPDNFDRNPETYDASLWQHEVKYRIIPNSRLVLRYLDCSKKCLNRQELPIVEEYRFHVRQLIDRHTTKRTTYAPRFPEQVHKICGTGRRQKSD